MIILINKENDTRITFNYISDDKNIFQHSIDYPNRLTPTDDALFRIALFSRPRNANQYRVEGVKVDEKVKLFFQMVLQASIFVLSDDSTSYSKELVKELPKDAFLCFSGGFDSIAAQALLGNRFDLVSIEFGGWFERESDYFKSFDTSIIRWDIRQNDKEVKFNETTDWRFLLSPALLFGVKNHPLAIASGAIIETSPFWFTGAERPVQNGYMHGGFGPSVALVNPLVSITGFLTTLITRESLDDQQLQLSLASLAAPNSHKNFRKRVHLSIIAGETPPEMPSNLTKYQFGKTFFEDIVVLYFIWRLGREWVEENYAFDLPEELIEFNMSFFEKYNHHNLEVLLDSVKSTVKDKLYDFGIERCTGKDLLEIERLKTFLNNR